MAAGGPLSIQYIIPSQALHSMVSTRERLGMTVSGSDPLINLTISVLLEK